ncbi:hypothetical protein HOY82DRAFT_605862 [Tuber indicum]|nr:hypothetical protein HOY82DRAFT_605862 [Tuber indicum]
MDDLNAGYESKEGEVEFCGRGRGLGEIAAAEIVNNEENADHEDEEEYQEVSDHEDDREVEVRGVRNRQGRAHIHNLPPVPPFEPYEHPEPRHKRTLNLPVEFSGQFDPVRNPERDINQRPIDFFTLFFDEEEFESLASNTNAYATLKEAGQGRSRRISRYMTQVRLKK